MRAAAGGEIEVLDVDQAQRPFALGLLAKRQRRHFLRSGEANRHRAIFPDDAVGLVFRAPDLRRRQLARQVDGRVLGAEMKALGPGVQQAIEGRRQHVLAGVLLHVIEAAGPVDRAADPRGVRRAIDDMQDPPIVGVDDVQDLRARQRADVERLAARGRIERRPIEDDGDLPLVDRLLDDVRVELAQVGVV